MCTVEEGNSRRWYGWLQRLNVYERLGVDRMEGWCWKRMVVCDAKGGGGWRVENKQVEKVVHRRVEFWVAVMFDVKRAGWKAGSAMKKRGHIMDGYAEMNDDTEAYIYCTGEWWWKSGGANARWVGFGGDFNERYGIGADGQLWRVKRRSCRKKIVSEWMEGTTDVRYCMGL